MDTEIAFVLGLQGVELLTSKNGCAKESTERDWHTVFETSEGEEPHSSLREGAVHS